jgi:hypothetical protein
VISSVHAAAAEGADGADDSADDDDKWLCAYTCKSKAILSGEGKTWLNGSPFKKDYGLLEENVKVCSEENGGKGVPT